jgi:hypothetical protein
MADALARGHAAGVVALRWPIVIGWIALSIVAVLELAPLSQRGAGAVGTIVLSDSRTLDAERTSASAFGFPLFSRTALARHAPRGLSLAEQARWAVVAAKIGAGIPPPPPCPSAARFPSRRGRVVGVAARELRLLPRLRAGDGRTRGERDQRGHQQRPHEERVEQEPGTHGRRELTELLQRHDRRRSRGASLPRRHGGAASSPARRKPPNTPRTRCGRRSRTQACQARGAAQTSASTTRCARVIHRSC